jgi:bacillithiol biosynthesis deacetylase BshB1
MKLDILAFKHIDLGYKCGLVDLTQGELGTRGSAQLRLQEAERAKAILGLEARENLGFADGFFLNDHAHQIPIIKMIRKYRPEIVLANSVHDRHPDHGKAAKLVADACFLSGLIKIDTGQEAWRPQAVYHYIQDEYIHPDLTIDITPYFDRKMESIKAYTSQFYIPDSDLPETPISGQDFMDFLIGRAKLVGRPIGAKYAEGFTSSRNVGVKNLFDLY